MTDAPNSLQILSLNVCYGQLADELASFIRSKMNTISVFCFQETDTHARQILDLLLSDNFASYHATKINENGQYYLSTYVSYGITVLGATVVHGEESGTGLGLMCRMIDSRNRSLTITNVHGTPRPGHKLDTPERVALSRELIARTQDATDPQLIIGDFNLLPQTVAIDLFTDHGFADLIREFDIPTTRNELVWQRHPAHMKQLYADYAFVRGNGIEYDFGVDTITVSDHLPLTVTLSLPLRTNAHRALPAETQTA